MSNSIGKVMVLGSSKAERIGDTNKMNIVVNAAALDIENNFLPLEVMNVYVNNQLIDTMTSDQSGELHMDIQLDYDADSEIIVQAEHKASGEKSPKKLINVSGKTKKIAKIEKEKPKIQQDVVETKSKAVPNKSVIDTSPIIAAMQEDGMALGKRQYIQYNDNYNIVLAAVKQNGAALEFVSERLQNDRSIVSIALSQDADNILFSSEELARSYQQKVQKAISTINKNVFFYARDLDSALKTNAEIILKLIETDPFHFQFVPISTRSNKKIVLQCISIFNNHPRTQGHTIWHITTHCPLSIQEDLDIKKAMGG